MKAYLSYILIASGFIILLLTYSIDTYWSGIASSVIACIFFILAIYFSRYIKK